MLKKCEENKMNKSKLQELCQKKAWRLPEYTVTREGQAHNPRFIATVVVNGMPFQSPNPAKSSKEAQNDAAQLAFIHFTAHPGSSSATENFDGNNANIRILQSEACRDSHVNEPAPVGNNNKKFKGSSNATENFDGNNANTMVLQSEACRDSHVNEPVPVGNNSRVNEPAPVGNNSRVNEPATVGNNSHVNEPAPVGNNNEKFKDRQHFYKNVLQKYTQKGNLSRPMYSCEVKGPPHASRFKCKVTIEGKTYESLEFFPTLKEAEHAAARVALSCLAPYAIEAVQEDPSLYKNLLQELMQKEGCLLPVYTTTRYGEAHASMFVSVVEVKGEVFTGQEATTKKQAEFLAAKVAYTKFKESKSNGCSMDVTPADHKPEVHAVLSPHLTTNVNMDECMWLPGVPRQPN